MIKRDKTEKAGKKSKKIEVKSSMIDTRIDSSIYSPAEIKKEIKEEFIDLSSENSVLEENKDSIKEEYINVDENKVENKVSDNIDNLDGSNINVGESEKDIEELQNKQIKWAVILMVAIILVIVIVFFIKNNFIDKFNYKGLVFQKTQLGQLIFYSTRFPVISTTGQVIGDYAVNLRNDPRKLDSIPINVEDGKIDFALDGKKYGPVYISINPFMKVCNDSAIAMITLSGFLRDSGLNVSSAVTDKAYARENNMNHRWCYDSGFDTVIIVTDGNKTAINEINPNCYEISFNECEIQQVSERFILNILEQYASRFKLD